MSREIFTDTKPECVTFEGDRERLDTAATLALFGVTE